MNATFRKTLLSVFALGLLGSVSAGLTGCRHHGMHSEEDRADRYAWVSKRAAKKLDLSELQQQQMQQLLASLDAERRALRGDSDPRADMLALVEGTTFDYDKALSMLTTRTERLNTQGPVLLQQIGEFYNSMTAEQQATLREHLQRWRD